MFSMKPSKRQKRMIAPSWAALLKEHINAQPRGYQAKMSSDTGCSEALISRIKNASIDSSEWVEVVARYCDLPIPPLEIDDAQSEMLNLSTRLSPARIRTVLRLMRDLVEEETND